MLVDALVILKWAINKQRSLNLHLSTCNIFVMELNHFQVKLVRISNNVFRVLLLGNLFIHLNLARFAIAAFILKYACFVLSTRFQSQILSFSQPVTDLALCVAIRNYNFRSICLFSYLHSFCDYLVDFYIQYHLHYLNVCLARELRDNKNRSTRIALIIC